MVPDQNFNGRIFVDQKLFFGDFEIGFSISKFKVRVHFPLFFNRQIVLNFGYVLNNT